MMYLNKIISHFTKKDVLIHHIDIEKNKDDYYFVSKIGYFKLKFENIFNIYSTITPLIHY